MPIEGQLRETEERLARILAASRMATWEWDVDQATVAWNDEHFRLFGHAPGAFVPTYARWAAQIHPDDLPVIGDRLRRALDTGEDYQSTYRVIRPDGSERWVESRGSFARDAAGRSIRAYGVIFDVTDRVRADEDLRERERLNRLAAQVAELGAGATDPGELVRGVAACVAEALGVARSGFSRVDCDRGLITVVAEHHGDLTPLVGTYDLSALSDAFRTEALAGRAIVFSDVPGHDRVPVHAELAERHRVRSHLSVPLLRQGRWVASFWASHHAPRSWTPHEIAALTLVADRVWSSLERLRAEAHARAASAHLRLVTDLAPVMICHCDADGRYTFVNELFASRFGLTPEEVVGRSIPEVLGEAAYASFRHRVEAALRGEPLDFEELIPYAWGARWMHAVFVPDVDPDGRVTGFVAAVHDVDARRRAEDALRDADRRKDEFLAMLAHELRNPLAPVRTAMGLFRIRRLDDPALVRARDIVDRQVTHLARLLDDLLDISRLSAGKLELQRAPTTLGEVIELAIEANAPRMEQLGQALAIEGLDAPIALDADRTRLAQVFGNLLHNASKYSPRGAPLRLVVRAEPDGVDVSLHDAGIGIPPSQLESVFELFSQTDAAKAHAPGGLGIGLSLARRLVEMHGGTIRASSSGPGAGSTFRVRLPLAATGADAASPTPAPGPDVARRVLVVDDNVDAVEALAMLLSSVGCDVRTAHSGAAALREAEAFRPDVVLLDIGLPDQSGHETGRLLRETAWGRGTRLGAVTGWAQREDRERSERAGFDAHFAKPVDPAALLRFVQGST